MFDLRDDDGAGRAQTRDHRRLVRTDVALENSRPARRRHRRAWRCCPSRQPERRPARRPYRRRFAPSSQRASQRAHRRAPIAVQMQQHVESVASRRRPCPPVDRTHDRIGAPTDPALAPTRAASAADQLSGDVMRAPASSCVDSRGTRKNPSRSLGANVVDRRARADARARRRRAAARRRRRSPSSGSTAARVDARQHVHVLENRVQLGHERAERGRRSDADARQRRDVANVVDRHGHVTRLRARGSPAR